MSNTKYDALRALARQDYSMTIEKGVSIIEALAPFFAPDPYAPDAHLAVRNDYEAATFLGKGQKIQAIKRARTVLQGIAADASLTNAKRIIDAWVADEFPKLNSIPF